MFSSLSKYSPKQVLATYLSQALAQCFNVDPSRVETNLIQDAKVVLNDIEIKERHLGGGGGSHLKVGGSMKQIEFSWVWDSSALIKDVRLTVRGVSVHVSVIQENDKQGVGASDTLETSGKEDEGSAKVGVDKNAPTDWKAKYLQQVIDHLTLAVTDVTIAIHLNEESQVVLEANNMELITLLSEGRKEELNTFLAQKISLASIEARIEQGGARFPILEPFGYQASVTRTSGTRFLDGILSGLYVEGKMVNDSSCVSSTIRIHAGIKQIAGLNSLQQVLLLVGETDDAGKDESTDSLSGDAKVIENMHSSDITETKSVFHIPFQSMELVLENKTNLRLAGCHIQYCTDGSELSVDCCGGIWVDDTPLAKDSRWILDLVSSELLLDSLPSRKEYEDDLFSSAHSDDDGVKEPNSQPDHPFRMDLSLEMFQKVYCGIMMIMPQCTEAKEIADQTINQYTQPSSSSSVPWSMRSTKPIAFRFTSQSNTWVEILAKSPHLRQGSSVFSFECKSIEVNSNAGFAIYIPHISTDDGGCILVEHRIAVNVDSMDTLNDLGNMWKQISDITGDDSSSSGVPFPISLAGCDVSMKEPHMSTVHMSRIRGSGTEWSIGVLQVHDVGNVSLDASSLQITLESQKVTMFVQKIKRLSYNKVNYLAAPIGGTRFVMENNDTLSVACKDVTVQYPEEVVAAPRSNSGPEEGSLELPLSFNLTVEHLRAESSTSGDIDVEGVNLWVRPTEKLVMVDLGVKSVKAKVLDLMEISCGKVNSSIEVGGPCGDTDDSGISIPGLGRISSSSMTIHDVTKLSTVVGYLNKPLDVVEIVYGGQTVMAKCNKVLFCTKTSESVSQSNDAEHSSPKLPFSVYFEAKRFVAMQDFGPGLPGLCFSNLQVHLTPSGTDLGVNANCTHVQGRGENRTDFAMKGVKLNCRKDLSDGIDEFLGLKEAHLSMEDVSTLSIPGKFKLAAPIVNAVIQLKNNAVDVKLDSVHASYYGNQSADTMEDQLTATTECADIPVPFSVTINQVVVDAFARDSVVVCNNFSTQYMKAPNTSSKSLHVDIASIDGKVGADTCKMSGISISTKWKDVMGHEDEITVPYLGSLSFAQGELEACTEMSTSTFSLIEPLHKPKCVFQEGFLVIELSEIQLDVTKAAAGSDQHSDEQSKKSKLLDSIRMPIGFNVSNKLRLKASTTDVVFENFGIDYVRSSSSSRGEVFIHCDKLVENTMLSAKKMDLHVNLSAAEPQKDIESQKEIGTLSSMFPGLDCVEKASLKIKEISEFIFEGTLRLSQPLRNFHISFQDGVVATDIDAIQFECLDFDQRQVVGLKKVNVKVQSDPFDQTIRLMTHSEAIHCNGNTSFIVTGVSLITTVVPTASNNEVLASKPIVIPSLGYASLVKLDVSQVHSLSMLHTGHLKSPTKLALRFENNTISLDCPKIILQQSVTQKVSPAKHQQATQPFELPCKASVSIGAFHVQSDKKTVQCSSLTLTMEPLKALAGQPKESIRGPGLGIQAIGDDFKSTEGSTVIDIPRLSVSGLLQLNDLTTVGNLAVGIEKAQIAAEFSMPNWSGSLDDDEPPAVIRLPFATLPKFDLTLHGLGKVVSINDATIACDEFQGTANTTLSQIEKHYVSIVKSRIPYLVLAKANVCGANVGDSVGMMAGTALTHTSVIGSTVGIAARDVVGSTLSMGKGARGASASDGYKFGDFSRGLVASVGHAAKSGSEMRGDDSYQVGDFTSGSAKAAGNYATENRCRLAGVGGSAAGMAVGAALLGPVGWVAGSMMGGSMGGSAMAKLTGDPKKKDPQRLDEGQSPASGSNATTQQQQERPAQAPDLLSFDSTNRAAQGVSPQQRAIPPQAQSLQQNSPDFFASFGNTNQASQGVSHRPRAVPPHAQSLQQNRRHGDVPQYPAHHSHNQVNTHSTPATARPANNSNNQEGYSFGDLTRGVIEKGKKADGRDDKSGYKFGDFTRGFFK